MSRVKNLTGKKFCRLLVVSRAENTIDGRAKWNCKCDCGTSIIARGSNLMNGHTQSCGCLKKERTIETSVIHGKSHTKIHNLWKNMKQRCSNPDNHKYKNYGGRGIKVCDEWNKDFQNFYDYVSQLPHYGEQGYSLDRIDNDGNYEPGNVKWSTSTEQSRNRRNCRYIYYEGEILTITELSEKVGIPAKTLYTRIYKKERIIKEEETREYARGYCV